MKFEDLRLSKSLLSAVRTAGYDTPTPIQAQAIPLILDNRDILGCAQTGTGKTAAFALPIIQKLMASRPAKRDQRGRRAPSRVPRALVVAPTRELAQQIADSFATYGRSSGLHHTVVFGGVNKNAQSRILHRGVDILVATPGRLLDHVSDRNVRLDAVDVLVLDEADHMLDMGFIPDIKRILNLVPSERQTLMFSATMPRTIRTLAQDILSNPASVEVARVSSPAESVDHQIYRVEKSGKPSLLSHVLENTPYTRALVFTRTKYGADKVVRQLGRDGVAATAIHGNKSQNNRTRALEDFRSGKIGVLVATDIAARGLDIAQVSHVINYDLTAEPETYIHRIGRTGRAGANGTALSFVSNDEQANLRGIEKLLRMSLAHAPDMPGYEAPAPQGEMAHGRSKPGRGPSSIRNRRSNRRGGAHLGRKPQRNRTRSGSKLASR